MIDAGRKLVELDFAAANAFVTEWNEFVIAADAPERAKWPLRKEDRNRK